MKLKFSALLSDARGILNGSYASRDRYGSVLRNRVIPRNPQSEKQQAMRALFAYIARRWRTISQHCRDEWTVYARTKPYTDVFGNRKFLQPNALFIQYNMNNKLYGFPFLECPIFENVEFPDIPITIDPPAVGGIWLYNMDKLSFYQMLVVQATRPTTAKKGNVEGDFTTIAVLKESDFIDGEYNAYQDYVNKIGPFENGQQIYFRYFFADPSGRVSLPKISKTTTNTIIPIVKDFKVRVSANQYDAFMQATILNQQSILDGKVKLYISKRTDHQFCPTGLTTYYEDGVPMERLLEGLEFRIGGVNPAIECAHVGIQFQYADKTEVYTLESTYINVLDLPME